MVDEDSLPRTPAPTAYRPREAVLRLPRAGLEATHALLRRAGPHESGLFWYGPKFADGSGHVQLVVAPRQRMARFNYHIDSEAVAEIVRQLPEGWKPLAQVHSHPGHGVEHSRYDDQMTMSQRALSIVFPYYGADTASSFPIGVGVHEYQSNYWHLLSGPDAQARIIVEGGQVQAVDLRQ